jgi:hypothetical protein
LLGLKKPDRYQIAFEGALCLYRFNIVAIWASSRLRYYMGARIYSQKIQFGPSYLIIWSIDLCFTLIIHISVEADPAKQQDLNQNCHCLID